MNNQTPEGKEEKCGKPCPEWWLPRLTCELPKGHKIVFVSAAKKAVKMQGGHRVQGNRYWPQGRSNMEWL